MSHRPWLSVLLLCLAVSLAQAGPDSAAREAFADGDVAAGIVRYRALLAARPDDPAAETWAMMLVRGLSLVRDHEAAVTAGREFQTRFPTSRFREKIAFLTAKSLLATGDGETASAVMTDSLERLRTTGRTHLVVRLVAEAEKAIAGHPATGPFDAGVPAKPKRAFALLRTAEVLGFPEDRRDALVLMMARSAFESGQHAETLRILASRSDPEATLLRARTHLKAKRADDARQSVEKLLAAAPDSPLVPDALLLLDNAEHLARFVRDFPADARAPRAALRRAGVLRKAKETDRAIEAYDAVGTAYPNTEEAEEAAIEAADTLAFSGRKMAAKARFEAFLRDFPGSRFRGDARTRIIEVWFEHGETLLDLKRIDEGASVLARLREAYPLAPQAAQSLLIEARARDEVRDSLRLPHEELTLLADLIARYPDVDEAPEAMLFAADLLTFGTLRFAESVEMLRRLRSEYPESGEADTAEERLEEMQEENLEVHLPAPLTSKDPRTLKVRTRNLEKLTGRIYRLDAEAYFRTHGDLDDLECIMVDVIEPDARFEHVVKHHEPLRDLSGLVEIPGEGPGAWLVVLEGGSLRATGLLLVSDVTVITKDTPTRTLAFVQDARTGRPVPGARVLVRGYDDAVREAITGEDGTAVVPFEHRYEVDVLAILGRSVALDQVESGGWKSGLDSRIHIATDRSVYRPGDEVKFRAIVRKGGGKIHVTPAGEPIRFLVRDRAGNVLLDRVETLSEYGAAAGRFELPDDIRPGKIRIDAIYQGERWDESCLIEVYRKPALFLDATPERPDHVRGEEIALRIAATHAFGPPAVEHPIRVRVWTLKKGEEHTLLLDRSVRTDEKGRAPVTFATLPGPDVSVRIRLESHDSVGRLCRTLSTLVVPETSYRASLSTPRPRIFVGDETRVDVLTLDVRGEPVATSGRIEVVLRDETLATLPVVTGPDGRGSVAFRPDDFGPHRFRFRALDRLGRDVIAACVIDARKPLTDRLVVLADRPRYVIGDVARVEVSSPGRGLCALLTYEGEDLHGHRVVRLDSERSRIDVDIARNFAPNVRVRVALAHDGRLHQGEDEIEVREVLRLEVEPERTDYGPGDLCRLRIRTTDSHGAPVSAEVGLAVVDEAIFRLHPDLTQSIASAFKLTRRRDRVETSSSLDFSHAGETTEISADLLAERDRRKRGEKGAGVLLEEGSLAKRIESRRDRDRTKPPPPGRSYRGPAGEVPANMRGPKDPPPPGDGAIPGVRRAFEDTAFFKADVVTGDDGAAVVEFRLPDDLTTWRVTARAASRTYAFDETRTRFTTTRPLSVRLGLPRFLREGDEVVASAATLNATDRPLEVAVELRPGTAAPLTSTALSVPPGHAPRIDLPLTAGAVGTRDVSVRATSAPQVDQVSRPLRTLRRGFPFRTGVADVSGDSSSHTLHLPEDRITVADRLTLHVAPSVFRAALDGISALRRYPHGCTEQTANRVIPVLALNRAIRRHGLQEASALSTLLAEARAAVIRLTYLQNEEGLWGWWEDDPSDPEMTAYALLALGAARDAGIDVPKARLEKAKKAVDALLARTTDPDRRAFLLLARTRAFGPDLGALAAAFADRSRLSPRGLAILALAHENLLKRAPANILLEDLTERLKTGVDVETLGWALAAVAGPEPSSSPAAREIAQALVARRDGKSFGTTRATGAAVFGLARVVSTMGGPGGTATVRVVFNGATVLESEIPLIDGSNDTVAGSTLAVPPDGLRPGKNSIEVTLGGRETVFWSLTATGLARTPSADAEGLALARTHALLPLSDGAPAAPRLVREDATARDPALGTLRVGESVRVTLALENRAGARYLAIEEPLPAGFEPVLELTTGPVAATERFDDRIVFFLTEPEVTTTITYVMRSEMPGTVHVPPGLVYAMYRPRLAARSEARTLHVAARDADLDREPTLGLDAAGLWWRARRDVATDPRSAALHIEALLARYDLRRSARRDARLLLARAREALGDAEGAARCFDRLIAESVSERLDFEHETRRARVYRSVGRHPEAMACLERANRLLLSDDRKAAVQSRDPESAELSILDRHPFSRSGETIWRNRAERHANVFESALAKGGDADAADLADLREFQARYPRSPAAPRIAYRLARALLRAGRFADLERQARRLSKRTRGRPLADDADWFVAFALFAQGRHDEAAAAAKESLEHEYRGDDGKLGPSGYRRNLIHLLAQVAHARGRLAEAVRLYREVEEYSADVREAVRELTERTLTLPAVVRVRAGEAPSVSLVARNLDRIDISVHPIDLLIYFTVEKDVHAVDSTNLDGLPPKSKVAVSIADAGDHLRHRVTAPLADVGPGVYLVIARAGADIEERSVLIVSDLEARIISRHDAVRVLVTDGVTGRPVAGAFVKVARGEDLIGEGYTDPRGVFEVKGTFRGDLSAVARKGKQAALTSE